MLLRSEKEKHIIQNGKTRAEFLASGDILQILENDIMVNQFLGNERDGSANRLYLKLYKDEKIDIYELTGIRSDSSFAVEENCAWYKGNAGDVSYQICFSIPREDVFFWEIRLCGTDMQAEIIYGQDVSMAAKGGTLTNELYVSQYLGHEILEGKNGTVICSRQNMSQNGRFPYLQFGCMNKMVTRYSTDAMQFFGKNYKETDIPAAYSQDLENRRYQYEMAYLALQTEKFYLKGEETVSFYGFIREDHPDAVQMIEYQEELASAYEEFRGWESWKGEGTRIEKSTQFGVPLVSATMTEEQLNSLFSEKKLEEYKDGCLLSFFTREHAHVVLKEKELMMERPHAHIIMTNPNEEDIVSEVMASTNFMYGVFHAQIVVGNTSMNKLFSVSRGLLNLFKNSGQRIYIRLDDKYRLLTIPAVYEMGLNYSRWYYLIGEDTLKITASCVYGQADVALEICSMKGQKYEFLITQQLVMGEQEYQQSIEMEIKNDYLVMYPAKESPMGSTYPQSRYEIHIRGAAWKAERDGCFYKDGKDREETFQVLRIEKTDILHMRIAGRLNGEKTEEELLNFEENRKKYLNWYRSFLQGLSLELPKHDESLEKINEMIWWYAHDALIHYITPHGVEQPGGAAWGTRDVCQGPFELFMSTGHHKLAAKILTEIFSHQFMESGEWPQWFMFDKYEKMMQYDCHGDVVFWPLKILGDYLEATGDYAVLEQNLCYHSIKDGSKTHEETLIEHVKRAINSIRKRFVGDTHLVSYAGGDWDDTLQPASEELKKSLISTWTVALAYQMTEQLGSVLKNVDDELARELVDISLRIKMDFSSYLIGNGVIAGFVKEEKDGSFRYLVHPQDIETGIKYRLLPMTRSIICRLVDWEQAKKNMDLIEDKLLCPDGVRLMDKPAKYQGGVSHFFVRAEQAANVGREIGLMYVHAHLRYIESLAVMGLANRAWDMLERINPINIGSKVKNAALRQSNCYFSSSDADFSDRYQFQEQYEKLYTGDIAVRGGWRVYSSGSGICLNQIITAVLGIRTRQSQIVIDPVLPCSLDGLKVSMELNRQKIEFVFHISGRGQGIQKITAKKAEFSFERENNPYRTGACILNMKDVTNAGQLEIWM